MGRFQFKVSTSMIQKLQTVQNSAIYLQSLTASRAVKRLIVVKFQSQLDCWRKRKKKLAAGEFFLKSSSLTSVTGQKNSTGRQFVRPLVCRPSEASVLKGYIPLFYPTIYTFIAAESNKLLTNKMYLLKKCIILFLFYLRGIQHRGKCPPLLFPKCSS